MALVVCAVCPPQESTWGSCSPSRCSGKPPESLRKGRVVPPAATVQPHSSRALQGQQRAVPRGVQTLPGACRPCPQLLSGIAGREPGTASHRAGSPASRPPARASRAGLACASCTTPGRVHRAPPRAALLFGHGRAVHEDWLRPDPRKLGPPPKGLGQPCRGSLELEIYRYANMTIFTQTGLEPLCQQRGRC